MRRAIQIPPKQLRALVLLMVFLPLVPTGLLVRLLWEERRFVREDVAEEMRQIYRYHLQTALISAPAAGKPYELADRLRKAFGSGVAFRFHDEDAGVVFLDDEFDASGNVVAARFEPVGGRTWSVEMSGAGDDVVKAAVDPADSWEHLAAVLGMLLLVFGTTGVAAFAITRRLHLEEMQTDSLTAISHELKTPVSSMRVLLETLKDGGIEDRELVDDYLQLLLQENHRLGRIVEEFLNHSRLEQRHQRFQLRPTGPEDVAAEAMAEIRAKVEERGGRLRCFGREIGMDRVLGDGEALTTVLVILLENAVKYSYGKPDIELDYFRSGSRVYFLVKDRGIGVARRYRKRIFDKFYQVDPKLSRKGGGCGLGLSIARYIVEAHGGEISQENRRHKGSVFRFHLPVLETDLRVESRPAAAA